MGISTASMDISEKVRSNNGKSSETRNKMSTDPVTCSTPASAAEKFAERKRKKEKKICKIKNVMSHEIDSADLARSLLYADHEILDDMVIGPTVLLQPVLNWLPSSPTTPNEGSNNHENWDAHSKDHEKVEKDCKLHVKGSEQHIRSSATEKNISKSTRKLFFCDVCGMSVKRKANLNFHICDRNTLFRCEVCGKSFGRKSHLDEHTLVHNQGKRLSCDSDSQTLDENVSDGQTAQTPTKDMKKIKDCEKNFGRKSNLDEPTLVHNQGKRLSCDSDGQTLHSIVSNGQTVQKDTEDRKKHKEGINPFKCDVCGKRYKNKYILMTHKVIHSPIKPYSCEFCPRDFNQISNLNQHYIIHHGKKNKSSSNLLEQRDVQNKPLYTCDVCGKPYEVLEHLIQHKNLHSKNKDTPHDLPNTNKHSNHIGLSEHENSKEKALLSAEDIKLKQETVSNTQKQENVANKDIFLDHYCDKLAGESDKVDSKDKANISGKLTKRVKIKKNLTIEKAYEISINLPKWKYKPKFIASNGNVSDSLTVDIPIDNSEKNKADLLVEDQKAFKCDVCGKAYKTKAIMMTHKIIHNPVKPYSCEICHKDFNQMSNLNQHNKNHHSKKPYSCEICNKGFNHASNLTQHYKTQHRKNPNACQFCSKRFKQKGDLNKHVFQHHLGNNGSTKKMNLT